MKLRKQNLNLIIIKGCVLNFQVLQKSDLNVIFYNFLALSYEFNHRKIGCFDKKSIYFAGADRFSKAFIFCTLERLRLSTEISNATTFSSPVQRDRSRLVTWAWPPSKTNPLPNRWLELPNLWPRRCMTNTMVRYNVCFMKIRTNFSSVLLLCLVRIFMKQMLGIL